MELKITKATESHSRYFKKEVLETGVGYVVSDVNSVVGMFSFLLNQQQATIDFPYCVNKQAIELAFNEFLKDYPHISEIKALTRQNLDFLGFNNKIYRR